MRTWVGKFAVVSLVLLLSLGASRAVIAQDGQSPAGEQDGLVSEETLSATTIDVRTAGATRAAFARLTLTEHGSVRLAASTQPSLFFVEEGTWRVLLDGKSGTKMPAGPVLANGTRLEPGITVNLGPGGWLSLPPRSTVKVSNMDSAPARALSVTFSDRAIAAGGKNATWQLLGDPVAVPAGKVSITLTRLTLDTGATTVQQVTSGPTVLDTQLGSVILVLNPGAVQISRAGGGNEALTAGYIDPATLYFEDDMHMEADDALKEPPATPLAGTAVGLGAGDGAVIQSGATRVLQVTDDTTAVVLVLTIAPAESDSAMPTLSLTGQATT